jgi:hypothetical protein
MKYDGMTIFNGRCMTCRRFAKVRGIVYDDFRDRLVEVWVTCKRHGAHISTDYLVWP